MGENRKLPYGGNEAEMTDVTEKNSSGYTVQGVVSRISALDVDAGGNAVNAAWKRYLSLSLLSLAKGWELKKVATLVFGEGAKPSKTFQNMASLARRARNNPELLGNHGWADIRIMGIDEAQDTVTDMINRHMAVLGCTSKNEYDKFADLSHLEAGEKREQEAEAKAATKATIEAGPVSDPEPAPTPQSTPAPAERTPLEAVKAVMQGADMGDVMAVMSWFAETIPADELRVFLENTLASLNNQATVLQIGKAA